MTRDERFRIRRRMTRRELWQWVSGDPDLSLKLALTVLFLAGLAYVAGKQKALKALAGSIELISPILKSALTHAVTAYLLVGGMLLLAAMLYPFGRKAVQDQLQSIGLVNHAGMTPELLRKRRDADRTRVTVWEFRNRGIPLTAWENRRADLEAALDITIIQIRYGKSKSRVLVHAVPARSDLPELLEWRDSYLRPDSFVLALGESLTGPVTVDLNKIPHILLGGSTGSGKSVLLKLLLMQALKKGAVVCIADFKGGVDYPPVWRGQCRMCFEERGLTELLTELVTELDRRKQLLAEAGCPNLDAYNKTAGENLPRCIFACDEVAELLDKTGRNKEAREQIGQIENKLAVIARLGRAFGIHLILATQRPDAAILPGQIRNNLDCRICGRADNVLSQIILDSTAAAEQIPKDARGRFLLHDGTVFQAWWFEDSRL